MSLKRPPDDYLTGALQVCVKRMRRREKARVKKWGNVKYYYYNHDEGYFYSLRVKGRKESHHKLEKCL